jgi:hypothetical protein
MFPSNPWKDVSNDGILKNNYKIKNKILIFIALSFLQTLLELDSRRRLHINKVFLQPWLQVEILV